MSEEDKHRMSRDSITYRRACPRLLIEFQIVRYFFRFVVVPGGRLHGVKRCSDMIAESLIMQMISPDQIQWSRWGMTNVVMAHFKKRTSIKIRYPNATPTTRMPRKVGTQWLTLAGSGLKPMSSRLQALDCGGVTKDPACNLLGTFNH